MRTLFVVLLLATSGCGADPLAPDFTTRLARFGGCADVLFFAVDASDEVMVTFRAEGLVAAARAAGTEGSTVVELPAEGVELIIEQGSRLSDATCDDVIENRGPHVDRTWIASSGTATVTIRPLEEQSGGRGDLLLEDVVFRSGNADELVIEELDWVDVFVGWYPG